MAVAVPARWTPPGATASIATQFEEDGGVRIVPIPTRGRHTNGGPGTWRTGAIRRLLTDFRPDIVQVEEEPTTPVADATVRIARRISIPVVAFTAVSQDEPTPFLARARRRRALSRAAAAVCANAVAASLVRAQWPELPTTSIPQLGLPVPPALTAEPHAPLAIGFVGRLVPEKGLDVLLRACAKLYGAWTLTVAGTGPDQEQLEALAERVGIASRVTWLGGIPRGDLVRLWPRFDCLVAPSRTSAGWVETYPAQVLEAMSHGVAVVVSDSGALPEVVSKAGLVIPDGHQDRLTEALARLMAEPELRERLAVEGRRRVIAEYVDDAVARKTLAFWERVLKPQ